MSAPELPPLHPLKIYATLAGYPSMAAFCRAIDEDPANVSRIIHGHARSWPRLRAKASAKLGMPEAELFPDDVSEAVVS